MLQESYQVRVATSAERLNAPDVWDSGRVRSRLAKSGTAPVSAPLVTATGTVTGSEALSLR